MSLDATVGGANSNSYLTRAEADAYWASRLFREVWDDAEPADKDAALQWATRLIDAVFIWTGVAATSTQALGWPRIGMLSRNGFAIPETVIPNDLKAAVAEFAGQLSAENRTEDDDALRRGLSSIKVGPVALTFKRSLTELELLSPELAYLSQTVPDAVRQLIPLSWYMLETEDITLLFEADQ